MLQEFDISITAVGDSRYLVRTEQVAPGVPLAAEQFHWPVEEWLQQAAALMHDPLLGLLKGDHQGDFPYRSGQPDSSASQHRSPSLVSLGQTLHNALFDKSLRDSWMTAQGIAQNRRVPLRLRLGIKDTKLQRLPWEVLHDGDRPLGTGTDVTFSRYYSDGRQSHDRLTATVPDFDQPLRILMVIATPDDQERLDLRQEAQQLKRELSPAPLRSGEGYDLNPQRQLDVQVQILEQPGRGELTETLEQGNFQVLHYAGHSNLGKAGGDLYLVSRQTGLTERISGEDLAGLLLNNGVKLTVLNSCRGAYTLDHALGEAGKNLAQALVSRGIPGVIAMAERIPDNVALTFTRLLYRNLGYGHPIDLCLNRTRQGIISACGSDQSAWALPILYMQPSFDGYLSSKAGHSNPALDQLLMESQSSMLDSISRGSPRPTESSAAPPAPAANDEEATAPNTEPDLKDEDFDAIVETFNLDEVLEYSQDDAPAMAELLEEYAAKATQNPQPQTVAEETENKPLEEELNVTDLLETPGLDVHNRLPQKPAPPPEPPPEPEAPKDQASDTETAAIPGPRASVRRRRQLAAAGAGLASLGLIAAIGISDPFEWFSRVEPTEIDAGDNRPIGAVTQPTLGADPQTDEIFSNAEALAAEGDLRAALQTLLNHSSDAAVLTFAKGQLQWMLMNQPEAQDLDIRPEAAMRTWNKTLESEPSWQIARIALGFAYYEQNELEAAIAAWEQAIAEGQALEGLPTISLPETAEPPELLHAHMGITMALYKLAAPKSGQAARALETEAAKQWQEAKNSLTLSDQAILLALSHWLWANHDSLRQDWTAADQKIVSLPPEAAP